MGLMQSLFGGSSSKNTNDSFLKGKLGGVVDAGAGAVNSLNRMLSGGFEDYLTKGGFGAALGAGIKGLTGGKAAQGLLRSGSAGQAFQRYGDDLRKQYYDNYLGKVGQLAQLGLGAGNTLAGTGQQSNSTGGIIPSLFG